MIDVVLSVVGVSAINYAIYRSVCKDCDSYSSKLQKSPKVLRKKADKGYVKTIRGVQNVDQHNRKTS